MWERKEEGFRQRAQAKDLAGYPQLVKEKGGGGGHSSHYFIRCKEFPEDAREEYQHPRGEDDGAVRYYLDDMEKLGRVAQMLADDFLLSGWRKRLFLSFMATGIIISALFAWLLSVVILHLDAFGQIVIIAGIGGTILWVLWKNLWPFFQILDWKIAIAPGWLQPSKGMADRLLLFQRKMPEAPNKIILARYTAKCPMCDGNIVVRKGGWELPGRLVGRCEHAPREHLFSFDHHLRIGKSIRD